MAQIVNLTSFAGSDGASIASADAGWVKHPSYSAGEMLVYQSRARQSGASTTAGFYRSESPSSANQVVTASIYTASQSTVPVGIACRMSATANEMILAQYLQGQVKLFKFVSGSATLIGSEAPITNPAAGLTAELQLEVSGQSPNISIVVRYNGAAVINRPSENIPALDAVGRVGIRVGTGTISNNTTGYHIASFAASDDSSAPTPPAGTTTISGVSPGTTSAIVTYGYSAADQTGFEYRLNGGTAASIGASPATISGLTAGTPYSIEVRAINATGAGTWSAPFSFSTASAGDATPPTLTGVVSFTDVTQTGYTMSWPAGLDNVAVTGYEYQIGGTAGAWTDAGADLSEPVSGRTPGATETVYVRAYDAAGLRSSPPIAGTVTLASATASITSEEFKNNSGTLLTGATIQKVWLIKLGTPDYTNLVTNGAGQLVISDAELSGDYLVVTANADGTAVGVSKATAS